MSWTILYVVLYLWAFWYAYILVMGIYRAYLSKKLTRFTTLLALPAILTGIVMDIVAQFTIATLFFLELPKIELKKKQVSLFSFVFNIYFISKVEHLVTARLKRYMQYDHGWRKDWAEQICTHLLDPFDPTSNHC